MKQRQQDIKKFGKPKYKDGDKVTSSVTGTDVLIIDGDARCNGFCWFYHFKNKDIGMGQQYLYPYISITPETF